MRGPHLRVLVAAARDLATLVLLPGGVDEDHVEFRAECREVERLEINLLVRRRRRAHRDQVILRLDQLLKLRVLFESLVHVRVSDKVGRTQSRVDEMLGVVVLGTLETTAPAGAPARHHPTAHA